MLRVSAILPTRDRANGLVRAAKSILLQGPAGKGFSRLLPRGATWIPLRLEHGTARGKG